MAPNISTTDTVLVTYEIRDSETADKALNPRRTVHAVFTGTTPVTVLAAPPAGQAYVVKNIESRHVLPFVTARAVVFIFDKGGVQTTFWGRNIAWLAFWHWPNRAGSGSNAYSPTDADVVLSESDETIVMVANSTCTDTLTLTYEIIEAETGGL